MVEKKQTKAEKKALRLKQRQEDIKKQRDIASKKRSKRKLFNLSIVALIVVMIVGFGVFQYSVSQAPSKYDAFAQCLTQAGVGMYGTDWCSHCQEQKRMFGKSFKYVTFINCDQNSVACQNEKVTGYPTWIFADGDRVSGVQALYTLAEKSGCQVES